MEKIISLSMIWAFTALVIWTLGGFVGTSLFIGAVGATIVAIIL